MRDGFIRAAAATPGLRLADTDHNRGQIACLARQAAGEGVSILVTPELSLTGYTCGDLFFDRALQNGALRALEGLLRDTAELPLLLLVGLPVAHGGKLYNCAAVLFGGTLLGLVPKSHLPNYAEFYERRQFTPAFAGVRRYSGGPFRDVPFGTDILFHAASMPGVALAVELCEDLWAPAPPSIRHALAGATVIANLSASNETIGKADYRRSLVTGQSARLCCGYLYACSGAGESTTDLVFAAHNLVAENGLCLAETPLFQGGMAASELDVQRVAHERQRMNSFPAATPAGYEAVTFGLPLRKTALTRPISPAPFIPGGPGALDERCETILSIQAAGLAARLRHTQARAAVLGVSGGLDSSLALLVSARAMRLLGRPATDILAVTMPAFGTTARTRQNAQALAEGVGATFLCVDVSDTVRRHLADLGRDENQPDVVYENAQARVRTLTLMDLANQHSGIVVGTGDLSELALGWATYNGDHMSMYGVNASVPKTLIRHIVAYEAQAQPPLAPVLAAVLDTPVSPELLPAVDGQITQRTEDIVGPYELHDFFLYYVLRWGFAPRKVLRLARAAFAGRYDGPTLLAWLRVFYRRFFAQQFKRSCLPDGPKVGSVSLSPRGDWRMPSDAAATLWLAELEALPETEK
ncbi:MAG: NAD(+) synthase [Oscillospiraceae bacterium]|jgi:NAD+ synthase (glutamine-hydrolysing)|nr:NAD(+) synthase [Oscillospiraceae bacterium]